MRTLLGCTLAALVVCSSVARAEDEKIDAKKLVGKWEPKEPKKGESLVIEFTKDDNVIVTVGADGKGVKFEGTYKVDRNKVTTKLKFKEEEKSETHTISKLTDTEMVSKEENGRENAFVRVKDK